MTRAARHELHLPVKTGDRGFSNRAFNSAVKTRTAKHKIHMPVKGLQLEIVASPCLDMPSQA